MLIAQVAASNKLRTDLLHSNTPASNDTIHGHHFEVCHQQEDNATRQHISYKPHAAYHGKRV